MICGWPGQKGEKLSEKQTETKGLGVWLKWWRVCLAGRGCLPAANVTLFTSQLRVWVS
jgi:hypothetical protein